MLKKIGALVLALLMVLSVSTAALAEDNPAEFEENDEEGVAGNWETADTERPQGDTINIKKEIKAFNPNATKVHAPVVTYTYTVTPADVTGLTVTDEEGDHESNTAAKAPIKAGLTEGLKVITKTSENGTLEFKNTDTWTTAAAGDTNEYDITLDFSGVTFSQPGVYRYQIAETILGQSADTPQAAYDKIAMEDGAYDTVYLDVYVDGNFDIYGYVCMKDNVSITPDIAAQKKINGFVNGTAGDGSDKYYTYDLTLSKNVLNDNYAATEHAFPFTVIFNNPEGYTSTFTIEQSVGTGSTGLNNSADTLTGLPTAWNGVALVKDGDKNPQKTVGDITLTGIPAGVDVDVYETNDVTGVTYTVATSVNEGTAVTDNNVSWGATPTSAAAQTSRKEYESTKATINTTKIAATDAQSVAITNTLLLISPTGLVLRIAPYVMILAAGIALLLISRRRKTVGAEE